MYPPNPHYDSYFDEASDDPEGRNFISDSDTTVDMDLPGPSTGKSRPIRLKCSSPPCDSDSDATVDMNLPGRVVQKKIDIFGFSHLPRT